MEADSMRQLKPESPEDKSWRPNIFIYGESGTGKTKTLLDLAKLTGAKLLLIDSHHGTDAWAHLYKGVYQVIHTDSPPEVEAQVDYYLEFPEGFTMFGIDDISCVHGQMSNMADDELRPKKKTDVGMFGTVMDPGVFGIIKRLNRLVPAKLRKMDMARIVVGRSKPNYKSSTVNGHLKLERSGTTWEGDNSLTYEFDLVLELVKYGSHRVAVVEKSRGMPDFPSTIEAFNAAKLIELLPNKGEGFSKTSTPNPVLTAVQAIEIMDLFKVAELDPVRQSKAISHYGGTCIEDIPRKHFPELVTKMKTIINKKKI